MAGIDNDSIMRVLEAEKRWLTFDELHEKVQLDCDWVDFAAQLEELVVQGKIQYTLPSGADVGYYGFKGLRHFPV